MYIYRGYAPKNLCEIKDFIDNLVDEVQSYIDADQKFKLKLILNELIINSFKHANMKKLENFTEVILEAYPKGVFIKVQDKGEGIPNYLKNEKLSDCGRGINIVNEISDKLLIDNNKVTAFIENTKNERKQIF